MEDRNNQDTSWARTNIINIETHPNVHLGDGVMTTSLSIIIIKVTVLHYGAESQTGRTRGDLFITPPLSVLSPIVM